MGSVSPFERVFYILLFLVSSRSDGGCPAQDFLQQNPGCNHDGYIGDEFCAHHKAHKVIKR